MSVRGGTQPGGERKLPLEARLRTWGYVQPVQGDFHHELLAAADEVDALVAALAAAEARADDLQRAFNTEVRVCQARTSMLGAAKRAAADAEALVVQLRQALEHYADPNHWNADEWGDNVIFEADGSEGGKTARAALAGSPVGPPPCECDAPRCERDGCQDKPTPVGPPPAPPATNERSTDASQHRPSAAEAHPEEEARERVASAAPRRSEEVRALAAEAASVPQVGSEALTLRQNLIGAAIVLEDQYLVPPERNNLAELLREAAQALADAPRPLPVPPAPPADPAGRATGSAPDGKAEA